uniref:Uncharacterized protein n=1 Tax=Anguilla anguilla TaxID=7936 RepID=A0A0E9RS64_ANGAN
MFLFFKGLQRTETSRTDFPRDYTRFCSKWSTFFFKNGYWLVLFAT